MTAEEKKVLIAKLRTLKGKGAKTAKDVDDIIEAFLAILLGD